MIGLLHIKNNTFPRFERADISVNVNINIEQTFFDLANHVRLCFLLSMVLFYVFKSRFFPQTNLTNEYNLFIV
jgi:hypothetical protein